MELSLSSSSTSVQTPDLGRGYRPLSEAPCEKARNFGSIKTRSGPGVPPPLLVSLKRVLGACSFFRSSLINLFIYLFIYVLFRMKPPRGVGSPALGQGSVRRSMTMRGRAPKSLKTSLVDLAACRLQLHAFRKCNGNIRLVGSQGSTDTYPSTTRTCITRLGY